MNKNECLKKFTERFGAAPGARAFFAPGRVNLIGEHIDYNGGHALPCALSMGTFAVARKRADRVMCFYSENFPGTGFCRIALDEIAPKTDNRWTAYPCGVIWAMGQEGKAPDCGLDIWIYGNIPNGSGLSSSASLEVLMGTVLNEMFAFGYSNAELAKIGQTAENAYVGMNCGILDQFAIAMGKKDCAAFLDTATLSYEYAPLELGDVDILIMNTCKKRGLKDSKYNERVEECGKALAVLRRHFDLPNLCAATPEQVEQCKEELGDVLYRRAKHVSTEDLRTGDAMRLLRAGELGEFGKRMNESHLSLERDYEVSGIELDSLVHAAWDCDGVIGARMTGAGFGGCAVALVRHDAVKEATEKIGRIYTEKTGLTAEFYIAAPGDGPKEL